jgi:hypothetical protein
VYFVLGNAKMVQDNTISVDDFANEHPTHSQCLKCILLTCFNVGTQIPSTEILELRVEESDKDDGLKVTYRSDVSTKQESAAAKTRVPRKHHSWWALSAWVLDIIGLPTLPRVGD